MAKVTFTLNKREIDRLLRSVDGPVGKDIARRAAKVQACAKRKAPVDTGTLRNSVDWELRAGRGTRELVARVGSGVHYAAHQEFGTRYQSGKSYLRACLPAAAK